MDKKLCSENSGNFIDNSNIFWEQRLLFRADGLTLNRSGAELLTSDMTCFLNQMKRAAVEDRQQESVQLIPREPEGQLQPTETKMEHQVQMNKEFCRI